MKFLLPTIVVGGAVALSWPFGKYMKWAMDPTAESLGSKRITWERFIKHILGSGATDLQDWKGYSVSLLVFNILMFALAYLILALQQIFPLNPDQKGALEPSLIFHTVSSFVANTNLQHYSGEQTLSYFSQLFAIAWLQFVSAATGIAALAALARGLSGKSLLGNFYQDLYRATFLVLLPLALGMGCLLILAGVPMTFEGAAIAKTLEGAVQIIARGPVAAVVAIKQIGTNGGGYFGPNSSHPFENPDFYSNIMEGISIILIPMASVWMVGWITNRMKHVRVVFGVMLLLLILNFSLAILFESAPTDAFTNLPIEQITGNLEGKELRFGTSAGPLWAALTTSTSNGSVNSMHDSLNPLTGLILMVGMWLNVIFGGVGVGFINMFLFIVVAVFIAGMMVGRTPEYLTRKVEVREMKLALIALLIHPLFILGGTALFAATPWGAGTVLNSGSHGFSEILYEFSSAAANNGSGFEGLGDNTTPWNVATGVVILLARFIPIIAPLAIAGSLASKRPTPETIGTFRTDTLLFGMVLIGTVVLVGALLFMPVAVLGPIAEYLSVH